ncbi:OmpA family protein [Cellulophaga sp. Hel_I_12]|uniref:OmpA family protein n=1 Tax=Cellulophaga sp. Hel_I_12 TaxID=1249972 RepID=UPI000A85D768|nr:OmpA family protein [Cellulophaga sp. Hel_I_12]
MMKKILIVLIFLSFLGIKAQEKNRAKEVVENRTIKTKEKTNSDSIPSIPIEEVTIDLLNALRDAQNAAKENPGSSKLIEKADFYFEKMWYVEAAAFYEMALKDKSNYSFEVLKKAGDAYYFNSNMDKAFYYYDILYKNYEEYMSPDNYFKYAHTLKGTGKYGKAKRLMRVYHKMEPNFDTTIDLENETPNEIVLDNILNAGLKFDIKNMEINSKNSDFSPMFYESDKVVYASSKDSSVYATRKYKWNDQPFLDLYVTTMNEETAELKNAVKFSKKINSKYHEASVAFSPDNATMYFTRNNYSKKLKRDGNGINHLKLYKSVKVGEEWSEATELPFNSDSYSTGHPALSSDGKLLYFVSDMPGCIGETDIFVVDVLEDGTYSEPRNLGPNINTNKKELFPFITDTKLYFSSNGHVGLGGLDIYESSYDVEGFQEAINVGKPVNSNKDDFSYIINEKNQTGYFASNRPGGKGDDDIYSFKVVPPEKTTKATIAGIVTELVTGDYMPEALVTLLDENNIKLKEIEIQEDGSFVFEGIEGNKKYVLRTTKDGFIEDTKEVFAEVDETVQMDVALRRLEERITVEEGIRKLKTDKIYFNFDAAKIRNDATVALDKLIGTMKEYPSMVIKIESHTDSRGPKAYNLYLSDKRAKATQAYMLAQGIDASRIESAIGYGEERLLNDCDGTVSCTKEKHELNRRSEFIIVKM